MPHEIVRYADTHYHEVATWFMKRSLRVPERWFFSDTGFIVDNCMVGFLYLTNSKIARLDCFISNPDTPKDLRAEALPALVRRLMAEARVNECKLVICNTKIPYIEKKATELGFKDIGEHRSFSKEIF